MTCSLLCISIYCPPFSLGFDRVWDMCPCRRRCWPEAGHQNQAARFSAFLLFQPGVSHPHCEWVPSSWFFLLVLGIDVRRHFWTIRIWNTEADSGTGTAGPKISHYRYYGIGSLGEEETAINKFMLLSSLIHDIFDWMYLLFVIAKVCLKTWNPGPCLSWLEPWNKIFKLKF